jgi:hypothetical protein
VAWLESLGEVADAEENNENLAKVVVGDFLLNSPSTRQ